MDRQELIKQYDRFISQVRTEIKELYWLYNFFFIIEVALIGSIFIGKINLEYLSTVKISGVLLSIYWLWVLHKQKLWRDDWRDRIREIEEQLNYSEEVQMWFPEKRTLGTFIF